MTSERWRKVEEVFEAAKDRSPGVRSDFLDEACAGDQSLREEVEALLGNDEKAGSFIEASTFRIDLNFSKNNSHESAMDQSISHYAVISEIGSGGMGVVYLARDTRLGRQVALKLLQERFTKDTDRVRRFRQEARAASALNHPNILTIHDIGETQKTYFIATEFVDGITLRERIAGGRMSLSETLNVITQVASALKAAHAAGIVHRDIKPENIMIRNDGYVKVLDFGLAKLTEKHSTDSRDPTIFQTTTGVLMGTPSYMSPEQIVGATVDARSDLFSLGAVLYECVASIPPFSGRTVAAIWGEIQYVNPLPPSQHNPCVTPELDSVTMKALAKKPEERYQSADELIINLRDVCAELQEAERTPTLSLPRKISKRRTEALKNLSAKVRRQRPYYIPIILMTFLVAVLVGGWFYLPKPPPPKAFELYEQGTEAIREGT